MNRLVIENNTNLNIKQIAAIIHTIQQDKTQTTQYIGKKYSCIITDKDDKKSYQVLITTGSKSITWRIKEVPNEKN